MSWLAGEILIVYYPMFISNDVVYWNPSSFCIFLPIIGNVYGFFTNFWLSLQWSVINLVVPSFLGIINMGVPYLLCCTGFSTPISPKRLRYLRNLSLFILGTV